MGVLTDFIQNMSSKKRKIEHNTQEVGSDEDDVGPVKKQRCVLARFYKAAVQPKKLGMSRFFSIVFSGMYNVIMPSIGIRAHC